MEVFSLHDAVTPEVLTAYMAATESATEDEGARWLAAPIEVGPELPNAAMPDVTVPFPGEWVLLTEFEDRDSLDAFSSLRAVSSARRDLASQLTEVTRVVMSVQPAQPGLPSFPLLGDAPLRPQPPAIVVLNAVGFLPNPDVVDNINAFFGVAGPLHMELETTFAATLQAEELLDGAFDFDILFSGEMRDEAAFDSLHEDAGFLDAALNLRNPSLRSFTENSGRVATELSP